LLNPFIKVGFDFEVIIKPADDSLPLEKTAGLKNPFIKSEIPLTEKGDFKKQFKKYCGKFHGIKKISATEISKLVVL
jgi:hypothetical protein